MQHFDHENLDVYRLAIELVAWVETLNEGERLRGNAMRWLDEASTSIALNIAEGNGRRVSLDRARFFDLARGSALECAACLDVAVAQRALEPAQVAAGKERLVRVVSMLATLIERLT